MAQENIVVDLIDGSLVPGDIYVSNGFLDVNNVLHLVRENATEVVIDLQAIVDNYPDKHVASGSFDDSTKQITLVFNDGTILPIAIDLSSITMDEWAGKNYEPTHTYDIGDIVTSPVDNRMYYAEETPQPGAPGTPSSGWKEIVSGGGGSVVYANRQEVFDGILLDKVVNPDSLNQKVPSSGSDGFVLTKGTNGNTWESVSAAAIDHNVLLNIGNNSHSQIDTHISNTNNPHSTTYQNIGGIQPAPMSHTHLESQITDLDKYTQQQVDDRDANVQGNLDTHVGKTNNPHSVTAAQVGAEPADSLIQAHFTNTSDPHNVTKAQVGLGSVNNTSDLAKPISTATQTALDLKVDNSRVLTDVPADAVMSPATASEVLAGVVSDKVVIPSALNSKVPTTGTTGQVLTKDSAGNVWADSGARKDIFYENAQIVSEDYTVASDRNAMTAGPIEVASGITVTIEDGATWVIV